MDQAQQRSAVVAEALSWLATPYHHHARIKGVGVDCLQILCAVYVACGVVPPLDPGNYAREWHLHHSEELYLQGLALAGTRRVQTPAPGDIAIFKFGRCFSHAAMVIDPIDGLVVHAYLGRGVVLNRLTEEPLAGREVQYWSPWA